MEGLPGTANIYGTYGGEAKPDKEINALRNPVSTDQTLLEHMSRDKDGVTTASKPEQKAWFGLCATE